MKLTEPAPIAREDNVDDFDSGEESLNNWLKKRALKSHLSGACRVFVVKNEKKVVAYYGLSAGSIALDAAPKKMQRNMPNLLPVLLLGRLAVDRGHHNKGIGKGLLRDAMIRATLIAEEAGVFAILVHALSDQAKQFYLSCGFVLSPLQPMTLFMTVSTIKKILTES
jgi:GNAT superfamily N-acetyltransferase